MVDRESLLRGIAADRMSDTPRLVYADWLDEQESPSDQDRATAEFIRVSCAPGKVRNVMPAAAYAWLDANWKRLVPSFLALHVGYGEEDHQFYNNLRGEFRRSLNPDRTVAWARRGRHVMFGGWVDLGEDADPRLRLFRVRFEFWKGFVVAWQSWGPRATHPGQNAASRKDCLFIEVTNKRPISC